MDRPLRRGRGAEKGARAGWVARAVDHLTDNSVYFWTELAFGLGSVGVYAVNPLCRPLPPFPRCGQLEPLCGHRIFLPSIRQQDHVIRNRQSFSHNLVPVFNRFAQVGPPCVCEAITCAAAIVVYHDDYHFFALFS